MTAQLRALIINPGHRTHSAPEPLVIVDDPAAFAAVAGGRVGHQHGFRTGDGFTVARPTVTFLVNKKAHTTWRRLHARGRRAVRGLPENALATALWWHYNRQAMGQVLYGPVIVAGPEDRNGRPGDVPAHVAGVYTDLLSGAYHTGFAF